MIIYAAPPPPSQTTPSHRCPAYLGSRAFPTGALAPFLLLHHLFSHSTEGYSEPKTVPRIKPDSSTKQDPCHSVQPRVIPLPLFLPHWLLLVPPQLALLFTRAGLSTWEVVFCFFLSSYESDLTLLYTEPSLSAKVVSYFLSITQMMTSTDYKV